MQVTLDLVGVVSEYYPLKADFSNGPVALECAAGTSVRDLLDHFGVPREDEYFIMLAGERVELGAADSRVLADGDAVSLIAVLKGG